MKWKKTELIIISDNFKKLIGLLINANIKFYIGEFHENYHVVGYREYISENQKLWEVDDRPEKIHFYDLVNGFGFSNAPFEEIIKYIFIIEEET